MIAFTTVRRLRPALAAVALGLALGLAGSASAQFGLQSGFQDAFRPGFTARDVQMAVDMLDLDRNQKFILETLYEDYQDDFQAGVNGFRQAITDMRNTLPGDAAEASPDEVMRVVFGAMEDWRGEAQRLMIQFTDDLKGLLNQEQMARWPAFERRLFRAKYLGNGRLPAESIDLTTAVRELELSPEQMASIKPLIDEYEVRLDAAIRERENFVNETQGDLLVAIQNEDPTIGIEVAQRQVELRKAVRDVNESYTVRIAEAIGGETGAEFIRNVREQTYARVYRITAEERIFEAATKIEDLDPEIMAAIVSLQSQFMTELEAFNDRLISIIRAHEPAALQYKVEQAVNRMSGKASPRLEDPTGAEFQARRDMARRYVDQLKALLAPEQFASLPGAGRYAEPGELQKILGKGSQGTRGLEAGTKGTQPAPRRDQGSPNVDPDDN